MSAVGNAKSDALLVLATVTVFLSYACLMGTLLAQMI